MPSCSARCVVDAEVRADSNPTVSPARCAHTIEMPSLMSNCLLSVPSPWIWTLPSVRTPSTSKSSSRMRTAFASSSAPSTRAVPGTPPRPASCRMLNHLRVPQVVEVDHSGHPACVDDDQRGDLSLFHHVYRFRGEHR